MEYQVACNCGNVLPVLEGMAGSSISCSCGRAVAVPRLSELRAQASTDVVQPADPDLRPPTETSRKWDPSAEIIAPVQVLLRTERGDRPVPVMVAVTPEKLWMQETWQLRSFLLQHLSIDGQRNGKELALALGPEPSTERLTLTFVSAQERDRWHRQLQGWQDRRTPDVPQSDGYTPEGVALVKQAPEVPYVVLGRVKFTGQTRWAADRGLQVRAGIRGADAIIELHRQKRREVAWSACHVSGVAVRVEDADSRNRLRLWWYAEEVASLVNRILLLLVIQAAFLFLFAVFGAGTWGLTAPSGETPSEAVSSAGMGMGMLFAWPLVLLALLRLLCWPQLLRIAGIATLAATTGRVLTVWLAHFLAVQTTGATLAESKIWMLADPIDWAFVIAGVVLCLRAWRLAREARQILPQEVQDVPTVRKAWSRGLLALTGVYAAFLFGFIGIARYQVSEHLLQPGVDPRLEHEALLALNEGAAQANNGELASAERSLQQALRLWEKLTARRRAPSIYRANLAMTLNDLGWIRKRQGRLSEAEEYYARAVSLADELAGDPQVDDQFKQTMASARRVLADLRLGKSVKLLNEKNEAAVRKYEEARVKADKGDADAERLYREAISLWEEILPQATNKEYQKGATALLAETYLQLGDLQQQLGNRSSAEASLKKAIDYGEKSVDLEQDRPLPKRNLEVARSLLDALHEQALQEEITKLCVAERFADAVDLFQQSIEEQEQQVRSGQNREAAERRLAFRLNRFAWFLAHCPDVRVRDAKAAVKYARRATDSQPDVGEFWYTLAMVQFRNGDWGDSLESLEQVKAREGGFDASAWFLSAMDLHHLKRRDEARAALRKGVEWIDERKRQAEENAVLRFQFEMMRSGIEALRREAENLIEGKDRANQGVG
jgi:tetratricopeptide (TPR) repeat protein